MLVNGVKWSAPEVVTTPEDWAVPEVGDFSTTDSEDVQARKLSNANPMNAPMTIPDHVRFGVSATDIDLPRNKFWRFGQRRPSDEY